jgi:hypothetical protein
MVTAARIELALVTVTVVALAMVVRQWPVKLAAGQFILVLSVVFLVQTLLRDIWLLLRHRLYPPQNQARKSQCFCLESMVGLSGVCLGLALIMTNLGNSITLERTTWLFSISTTMLVCYWLRDYVFSWNPWRIYKDPDHANIILAWR